MLRYLALVWNDSDPMKGETAHRLLQQFLTRSPNWQIAVNTAGLSVVYQVSSHPQINRAYTLPHQQGVILGKLFDRCYEAGDIPTDIIFDESRAETIVTSAGRDLLKQYWGQYVAFLHDGRSYRTWALRDPTGVIPCYMTTVKGIDIYFRGLEDCQRLAPLALTVNRKFMIQYLAYDVVFNELTGLNEITTLLAGECVEHWREARTKAFVWNPLDIANTDVVEDFDEAVKLTRSTVQACVHAWASCFDSFIHDLSGGLDSSIVLACLKDAPTRPHIVCENRYGSGANDDERRFARLAARLANCELVEAPMDFRFNLRSLENAPHTVVPLHRYAPEPGDEPASAQARASRFAARFRGDGGDELFLKSVNLPTATDFAYRHGIRPRLLQLALQDAELDDIALWRVLRRVGQYGILKQSWSLRQTYSQRERELALLPLSANIVDEALHDTMLLHPLYRAQPAVPPGKLLHAGHTSLAARHHHAPRLRPDLPPSPVLVAPLNSQPFIELSLRIPVYVLRHGARDRAVAREAFAKDLPREIALRKSKSCGNESIEAALNAALEPARELLLDGLLVQEGLLDRAKLDGVLHPDRPTNLQRGTIALLECLAAERWYREWLTIPQRAVA